jgi:peptide/bleomycin uptake transporter
MALWYSVVRDLGPSLSIGPLFGFSYPAPLAEGADPAQRAAYTAAITSAIDVWLYQYMIVVGAIFCAFWAWFSPHRWFRWSVVVSSVIIFITWFQVQLNVMINNWFQPFYDLIQKALVKPNSVTIEEWYATLLTFFSIASVIIATIVLNRFIVSHYVFRWRTAMNDFYVENWPRLRHIEGAAQRIQEDTMRFATITEDLGVSFIDSVMTLIAFLPILWTLSAYVKVLPVIGEVSQALVFVAVLWAALGTGMLALAGIRLPGIQFRIQRVEAAYRKELVLGEDNADRAQPPTLAKLFADVRHNYFHYYLNYLYFNFVRYAYLQTSVLVPYIALGPSIVAAGFTLGIMQQIIRAFNQVEASFQYLVNSWATIVELISIYKRLHAFEATLRDQPLSDIEHEVEPAPGLL